MAAVGDRVQVPSKRVGQAPRQGVVIGASASGGMLRVRWSSGEESTITPSMGSLVVVGKARVRDGKASGVAKSAKSASKTTSKKASGTPKDGGGGGPKRGGGKASGKGGRAPKRGK